MTTTSPGRRPPDRDRQLAAVATDLFRARGYAAVSVNDIAAAAGVTGAALYRHYSGKQALLARVIGDGISVMESATARYLAELESAAPGAPRPDLSAALLDTMAAVSLDQRDVTALWRTDAHHLTPDQQHDIARRTATILTRWSQVLRRARPGLPPADAELLCWSALAVFGSTSVHRTSLPKTRYAQRLTSIAARVLHAKLPVNVPGQPVPAPDPAGQGRPGVSGPAVQAGSETPGRALIPEPRHEQLIRLSAALFQQRGFTAVSMEDIGEAAGIAGPSIYRHFPSKSALLAAITRRAADRVVTGADEALRAASAPADTLARLTASYAGVLTGHPELAVFFSIDQAHLADADRAQARRVQRDYVARWTAVLQAADPGLSPPEAKVTVHAALTIGNDLTRTRRVAARPAFPAELATLMTAALGLPARFS